MDKMTRRNFLQATGLTGIAVVSAPLFASVKTNPVKPDILLLMPDQMRGDCIAALGHPAIRTDALDQLAKEGMLFRRAYATVASCIPARYSLLTGIFPQTSGCVGFRAKPFKTPTMPEVLANAGYSSVLVGRNMHQQKASGDCGYTERILGSTYIDDDEYDKFLRKAAPKSGGSRNVFEGMGITANGWKAKPWPLDDKLHPTEWVVSRSRDVVKDTPAEQPLFLTTSFYAPHPPLFPPKKYFDKYMNMDLPKPARGDWVDWKSLTTEGDEKGHRVLLKGNVLKESQAGYFGLIEHIDDQIALLIKDFKARSEKAGRPWVIIFTSDHGEMLGDHGYFRKCEPFEGSANIPFIITGSKEMGFKQDQINKQPVCLEDIMPTLLALAGKKKPSYIDGVNLVPVLSGHKQDIRKWLHFEHAKCYSEEQAYHGLTDGKEKYIWRALDGTELLFDLEKDIAEEHNLSKDKAHSAKLEIWRNRLIERLKDRPEGFVKGGKLIAGRPYKGLNIGTMPQLLGGITINDNRKRKK